MASQRFTIGLDFGTNSVRALVVDVATGAEVAAAEAGYSRGERGVITSSTDPHLARQHPADYHEGLVRCIVSVLKQAEQNRDSGFSPDKVIGIGVDTTGSTPLPVTASGKALGLVPEFASDPNAYAWLWKDHTASDEADEITRLAREHHPEYLERCGGTYSSEWFWAKILHCRRVAPNVFASADSWVELCDYIPALLVGVTSPGQIVRSVCAAGHKAMFAPEWGGLPDPAFLDRLHPDLAALRSRLYTEAFASDTRAGTLCAEWAETLGLPVGIAVAVGAFDVHHGAVGAGIAPGTLVKAIGTSTCDIAVAPLAQEAQTAPTVPGLCGIVNGSALPDYWGIEAGQSAVGDLLNWFVSHVCEGDDSLHAKLTAQAAQLAPGESGLLALDWNNGNRTVLIDQRLSGLMLGQTLATTRAQMYRALIEATAFGAHTIQLRLHKCGVPIKNIVACGGITQKNPLFMQIYADVFGEAVKVTRSPQTCALGAAIFASVAAGPDAGGYQTTTDAQAKMATPIQATFHPDPARHVVYAELYALYRRLHDSFGVAGHQDLLFDVMKSLLTIQKRAIADSQGETPMRSNLDQLKQQVLDANLALGKAGLVLLTWGNVSGRDPETGPVVIKPSGVDYDALRLEHMVVVDPDDGRVVEGGLRPSSDTPTHLVLYRQFPGIGGVAHSHSTYATAWAQARQPIDCLGTTHADHFRGTIPVTDEMTPAEISGDYEVETGNVIARAFQAAGCDPLEVPGVLVAGHGPFTWGSSPAKAVENGIVLEQVARMKLLSLQIAAAAGPISDCLRDRHFYRKHGPGAYYGQSSVPQEGQGPPQ